MPDSAPTGRCRSYPPRKGRPGLRYVGGKVEEHFSAGMSGVPIPDSDSQLEGSPIRLPVPTSGLQLQQGGKPPSSAYELLWWTHFHDLTSLHYQDLIGVSGRGQAMGHSEYRAAAAHDR